MLPLRLQFDLVSCIIDPARELVLLVYADYISINEVTTSVCLSMLLCMLYISKTVRGIFQNNVARMFTILRWYCRVQLAVNSVQSPRGQRLCVQSTRYRLHPLTEVKGHILYLLHISYTAWGILKNRNLFANMFHQIKDESTTFSKVTLGTHNILCARHIY